MELTIKRGDIYYAELNPVIGSEQGGTRPVLIISNDIGNKHSPIKPEKTAADIRRGAATKPQSTEAPISTRQEIKSAVRACLSAMRMRPTLCIS